MKKNLPLSADLSDLKTKIDSADALIIGAGAGLSTASGLTYSGERFIRYFADFHEKYPDICDIYSGGFAFMPTSQKGASPFSQEEQWGWWCRHIYYNRFLPEATAPYMQLLDLVKDKNYFVLTTNVDHQFQKAGFDKNRLYYTQGDYGLFQCDRPCKQETFDNESQIKEMMQKQEGRFIPTELIPKCPHCGEILVPHLRKDAAFVEDEGWHNAQKNYANFLTESETKNTVFLELGVDYNTPGIIKYPF